VLKPLDARAIYAELEALAGGAEPVLLCYEEPGELCHRRIVAAWFERKLKIKVPEL
jgi:hypothetical protein